MAPIPVRKHAETGTHRVRGKEKIMLTSAQSLRIISYLCTAISLNTLLYMQKNLLLMAIVVAVVCCLGLASCGTDDDDSSTAEYRAKIVNTRWQLTEVQDHNNEWRTVDLYQELNIPELKFNADNSYQMRISRVDGYSGTSTAMGTYTIRNRNIEMTDYDFSGIIFYFYIQQIDDNAMECRLKRYVNPLPSGVMAGNDYIAEYKDYVVRMKRLR